MDSANGFFLSHEFDSKRMRIARKESGKLYHQMQRAPRVPSWPCNCHVTVQLVTLLVAVYYFICKKNGISREFMPYKPLGDGGEVHTDSRTGEMIKEPRRSVEMHKAIGANSESAVKGHGLRS